MSSETVNQLYKLHKTISGVLPLLTTEIQHTFQTEYTRAVSCVIELESQLLECAEDLENLEDQYRESENYIETLKAEPEYPTDLEEMLNILTEACKFGFDSHKMEELISLHKSFMRHERETIL